MPNQQVKPSEIIGRLARADFYFDNLPIGQRGDDKTWEHLAVYRALVNLLVTEYKILEFEHSEARKIMEKKTATELDFKSLLG